MKKKCQICGSKISKKTDGLPGILNEVEQRKILKLKQGLEQTICMDCKKTMLAVNILSPF